MKKMSITKKTTVPIKELIQTGMKSGVTFSPAMSEIKKYKPVNIKLNNVVARVTKLMK